MDSVARALGLSTCWGRLVGSKTEILGMAGDVHLQMHPWVLNPGCILASLGCLCPEPGSPPKPCAFSPALREVRVEKLVPATQGQQFPAKQVWAGPRVCRAQRPLGPRGRLGLHPLEAARHPRPLP